MSIQHHPDDILLFAFAAGTLDLGQHTAVATHLVACPRCRAFVQAMERVGGAVMANLQATPMASGALASIEARLGEAPPPRPVDAAPTVPATEVPGLPKFVRRYQFGPWKWIAPFVHVRPIVLPEASDTRVFLLRSGSRHQDAATHTHRRRDDMRAFRRVPPRRRPLWTGRLTSATRRSITCRSSMPTRTASVSWPCKGSCGSMA